MPERKLLLASAFFMGMWLIAAGKPAEPVQALCKVVWLFGLPCAEVNMAIVNQIKAMTQYKLGMVSPALIEANHSSMMGQVENINFTLITTAMGQGCHVDGSSVAAFWHSLFDNGTNYCNLHNVIQGSGLSKAPGYTEYTNEWICLGYGLTICKL